MDQALITTMSLESRVCRPRCFFPREKPFVLTENTRRNQIFASISLVGHNLEAVGLPRTPTLPLIAHTSLCPRRHTKLALKKDGFQTSKRGNAGYSIISFFVERQRWRFLHWFMPLRARALTSGMVDLRLQYTVFGCRWDKIGWHEHVPELRSL